MENKALDLAILARISASLRQEGADDPNSEANGGDEYGVQEQTEDLDVVGVGVSAVGAAHLPEAGGRADERQQDAYVDGYRDDERPRETPMG